jgi:CDP-diacylglycerol---serine O-phosphatidyltransferase
MMSEGKNELAASASWTYGHVVPNSITVLALAFGMTAFTYAASGLIASAIACVLIAAVLDACDGRVARRMNAASRFGAELDSLADVICFGAAPAFIVHQWGLNGFGLAGWLACLLPAIAAALRLARFNVMAADANKPSWSGLYFTGVPAPAGAFLTLIPIYLEGAGWMDVSTASLIGIVMLPLVAVLMVSTLPTFSGKQTQRKAMRVLFLPTFALGLTGVAGLSWFPWQTLAIAALVYVLSFPFSYRSRQKKIHAAT